MPRAVLSLDAGVPPIAGPLGPSRPAPPPLAVGRVDDELVRRHVGPGPVEHVAEPLRGQHDDQDGDQHAEADGGERRAERARYRARSRRASRAAIGARAAEPGQHASGTTGPAGSPPRSAR